MGNVEVMVREPPTVTDVSMFEWTTKNLFGERSLWKLVVDGGAERNEVRLVHDKMVRQIKAVGLRFGTGAILCRGTKS